jgi:hypothetical protein
MNRCVSAIAWSFVLFASLMDTAALAQRSPVPLVNQPLSPTSVAPGHAAFTLTLNGTGFASDAVVNWNGSARATTFISSSLLQATITAADVARPLTASITVTNPSASDGISNVVYFMVSQPPAAVAFARFDTRVSLPAQDYVSAFAVADFNNDGKLDLAIAHGASTIEVLLGNGDGTFRPPISTTFNIGDINSGQNCGGINSLVVGNFNGDNNLDLAFGYACSFIFADGGYDALFVALGTGDGRFTLAGNGANAGEPLLVGDFNADGELDLITATPIESDDWFSDEYLGRGAGTFDGKTGLDSTLAFGIPAVGDFNHDGNLDLAVPDLEDDQSFVDVNFGDGHGSFRKPVVYTLPFGVSGHYSAGTAAVGDLNRDGNLDIVAGSFSVLLGDGGGNFINGSGFSLAASAGNIQLADFNNDNNLDLVLMTNPEYEPLQFVTLLLGNGDGTFQNPQYWNAPSGGTPVIGDFDGDGMLDLLTVGSNTVGSAIISLFRRTTLSISPSYLNFQSVKAGSITTLTSTLTNIGQAAESIDSIELENAGRYFTETNDCGGTIAPGASCTVTVEFFATSPIGAHASVNVAYGGAIGSPQSIVLTGSVYY